MIRHVAASLLISATLIRVASASVINGYQFTPPNGQAAVTTLSPNNDSAATAGQNLIAIPSSYAGAIFDSAQQHLTLFSVSPSGGTTEYLVTEMLTNHSGTDWSGFSASLGPDVAFARFDLQPSTIVPSSFIGPFLYGISAPAINGVSAVDLIEANWGTSNQLPFNDPQQNGSPVLVPDGGTVNLAFVIKVEDNDVPATRFTFMQAPIVVPEPAAVILLAIGAIGAMFARRRFAR